MEAVRLALAQIKVQKLKSFFTLLGVMIGVMFLIAVVSIVEGMGRYMEDDFAGRLLGVRSVPALPPRAPPAAPRGTSTGVRWPATRREHLHAATLSVVRKQHH